MPVTVHAMDDYIAPSSSAPTAIKLCGGADGDKIKTADCKQAGYDKQVAQIDKAFNAAIAKTPANIKPLLKRDQAGSTKSSQRRRFSAAIRRFR